MTIVFVAIVGVFGILLLAIYVSEVSKKDSTKERAETDNKLKQKKPSLNIWANEVCDVLEKNAANSVLLCSAQSTLPRIPKGDRCYLLTEEDRLSIKTVNEPIMTYGLDYEKIYLFKKLAIYSGNTINQVIIQYVDDDSSIKELGFAYGNFALDNAFNKYAMKESNIFEVVESKIPRRDNDVML